MPIDEYLAQVRAKKALLGIRNTAEDVDSLRNKGGNRTESKRELLRRIEIRSLRSGLDPVVSYY